MSKKKKYMVTCIAGGLLLVLYSLVFSFSEQDGETSGSLSRAISEFGVKLWNQLTGGNLTELMMKELALYFENPVRKAAHFVEYAVMGILVYSLLYCYVKSSRKRYWFAVLWVFLSAAADEMHQLFVPGRSGNVPDVFLDTAGGMTGALLCGLLIRMTLKRKQKKKEGNCNE